MSHRCLLWFLLPLAFASPLLAQAPARVLVAQATPATGNAAKGSAAAKSSSPAKGSASGQKGASSQKPGAKGASSQPAAGKGSPSGQKGAPAPKPLKDLTVLPLVAVNLDPTVAADLTGIVFTELKKFEGVNIRVRSPKTPLQGQCLSSAPCLQKLGRELEAGRLLLGLAKGGEGTVNVTMVLFDVAQAKALSRVNVGLSGKRERYGRMLRPVVGELALAAGARPIPVPTTTADGQTVQAPPVGGPTSLETMIAAAPTGPAVATPPEDDKPASQAHEPEEEAGGASRERQEKSQQKEVEAQARKENAERERERRQTEAQREVSLKQAEAEARARQQAQELEAKARTKELERRRKIEQKWRDENQKRSAKGLPPLPEPAELAAPAPSAKEKTKAPKTRKVASTSSAKASAKAPPSGEELGSLASGEKKKLFLENENVWQVGSAGSVSYLCGYSLLGAGLEVSYAVLPWLWVDGGLQSMNARDDYRDRWFFMLAARGGVSARLLPGPFHPFAGLDVLAVGLGGNPQVLALGGTAHGGVDLMFTPGLSLRLEGAGGALYSPAFEDTYLQYASATQLFLRFGVGMRYRF